LKEEEEEVGVIFLRTTPWLVRWAAAAALIGLIPAGHSSRNFSMTPKTIWPSFWILFLFSFLSS
jgi:hypothetical protein